MNRFLQTRVLRPRLKLAPRVMAAAPIPQVSAYADTDELLKCTRAQSVLSGPTLNIGREPPYGQAPLPTSEQADVILRWARP